MTNSSKIVGFLALVAALASGCSQSNMKAPAQPSPAKSPATEPPVDSSNVSAVEDDHDKGPVLIEGDLSDDDEAVNQCLLKFGNHPFTKDKVRHYRKINASVTVLGYGNAVSDTQYTKEPSLVLVKAAVNVLGPTSYQLHNANGWYCIKAAVDVLAQTDVNLHCKAHLADNKSNVNVGGSQQGTAGRIGVNVFSDVRVNSVGCP